MTVPLGEGTTVGRHHKAEDFTSKGSVCCQAEGTKARRGGPLREGITR
jgi:hypothetical protein